MCLKIPLNDMWCVSESMTKIYVNKSHSQFQSFNSYISGSMWLIELIKIGRIVYNLMGTSCN